MANTGPSHEKRQAEALAVLAEKEANIQDFLVNGALTKTSGIKKLTKASAGAYTLAAPTAAEEGAEITIVANTAFAHVITATGLINDGVTGGSKNTITMGAFVGASITLIAMDLKWTVKAKTVATVV